MDIVWLGNHIRPYKSTTQYQRMKLLSEEFNLYLVLDKKEQIPDEIKDEVNLIRTPITTDSSFLLEIYHQIYKFCLVIIMLVMDDVSIVYTTYSPPMIIMGVLTKPFGSIVVFDIWDHPKLFLESYSKNIFFRLTYLISKRIVRFGDLAIVAIEPNSLNEYSFLGVEMLHITNGVHPSAYPKNNKENLLDKDTIDICYLGVVNEKRIGLLISSTRILNKKNINYNLRIIGPVGDHQWLKDSTQHLSSRELIVYDECTHDKAIDIITTTDICVLPIEFRATTNPTYPIKLLEYFAMGIPTIATNLDGITEIGTNGKDIIILEDNNPRELADKIMQLKSNPMLYESLSEESKKTASAYNWEDINEKIIKRLRDL